MSHIIYFFKYILVIILFAIGNVFSFAQTDSTMRAIRDNTLLTAEHTAKDNYDYLAIAISLFAFVVGLITLGFTYLTYKSQKKTELNTRKWDSRQERMNLRYIMRRLMNNIIIICNLKRVILNQYSQIPESRILEDLTIDVSDLHSDDYIGEGVNHRCLKELKLYLQRLNTKLKQLHDRIVIAENIESFRCIDVDSALHLCLETIEKLESSYESIFTYVEKKRRKRDLNDKKLRNYAYAISNSNFLFAHICDEVLTHSEYGNKVPIIEKDSQWLMEECNRLSFYDSLDDYHRAMNKPTELERILILKDYFKFIDLNIMFPYMLKTIPLVSDFMKQVNTFGTYTEFKYNQNGYIDYIHYLQNEFQKQNEKDLFIFINKLVDDIFSKTEIKILILETIRQELLNKKKYDGLIFKNASKKDSFTKKHMQ